MLAYLVGVWSLGIDVGVRHPAAPWHRQVVIPDIILAEIRHHTNVQTSYHFPRLHTNIQHGLLTTRVGMVLIYILMLIRYWVE